MGFSKVDGALANALADEAEHRIGARIPKDTTAMLAKLNESIAADARDAARMREMDALVSGPFVSFVERVAEGLADEHARRHPNFNTWREMGEKDRQIWVWMVRESTTAFAAALLTDGAVRAAAQESYRERYAVSAGNFPRSIMVAAIRAAGVEPVERTQSCLRCDMHAEEAKAEKARADEAEDRAATVERERDASRGRARQRPVGHREAGWVVSAARYGVRLPNGDFACVTCRANACTLTASPPETTGLKRATAIAKRRGGRVVRLLTPAESRRKAAADALRELASALRSSAGVLSSAERPKALRDVAEIAEARADALWPRKGAGR